MRKPVAILAAALLVGSVAHAQVAAPSLAVQQVELLAPQLVAFAGSPANFESLVSGLITGQPVILTAPLDGALQIATFTPPGAAASPVQAAQLLETARQNLIVRGVATPTPTQLAVALAGGTLVTASGAVALAGVLNGTTAIPVQVRTELVPSTAVPGFAPFAASLLNLSPANLRALQIGLASGTAVSLTGAGAVPDTTFVVPGGPLSPLEINQTLQLAALVLAQQGIFNPTPEQLRVALVGGTLTGVGGAFVPVRGVLQGRTRFTYESRVLGVSNSPFFGTSNTPPRLTAQPSPPPVLGVVVNADGVRRANTAEGAARRQ